MHGHHNHHNHHHHHDSTSNIKTALILNFVFSIIELIGGILTQSVAILSDAVHDMGDTLSLAFSYFLEKKSKKESNKDFSYGYKRLSLLSAVITACFLIVGSIFVLIESLKRLFNPVQPHVEGMIFLAILGIAVNGYAAWKTSHGKNMNERVISWHMIEDLLGWVVVFIGSIVMLFVDFPMLDPILSIGFSLFILRGVYKSLTATVKLFLQGVPDQLDLNAIMNDLTQVDGIIGVHDCHLWSLDGESHVLTIHAVIGNETDVNHIKTLKQRLRDSAQKHGHFHLTIEFETESEHCHEVDCVKV